MSTPRSADFPIDSLFLDRWSPRSYDAQTMPENDLLTLLEAARWAPSAYNIQPWRFLYALRGDAHWEGFLALLDDFNRSWAKEASALVILLSNSIMPGDGERPDKPSRCNSFDAGAAWAQMALQATRLGYQAHGMAGIYHQQISEQLKVPDHYRVEIAVAIGRRGTPASLPADLQEREMPSDRLSLKETAFPGSFPAQAA
ncbi:nitroreductase family protein [Rhodovibrionaceae bacterium A322]